MPAGFLANLSLHGTDLALPVERLFDDVPNVVFFIKDRAGRYLAANRALVERCGAADKSALLGKRPSDFYPASLATRYERQDLQVVRTGKAILDQLELHLYPGRRRGWCLTNKYPVTDRATGAVAAVMGVSRDVEDSARGAAMRGFPEVARALETLQTRIDDPPSVEALAGICGLSVTHFARLVQRLFHLTPRQLVMKVRIDEALHLLATTDRSLTDIALSTGFCDQSAFTRHFRRLAGIPPGAFRQSVSESGEASFRLAKAEARP